MGKTIHEIYLISNVEQKLTRMAAAHKVYDASVAQSAATNRKAIPTQQHAINATNVLTKSRMRNNNALKALNASMTKNVYLNKLFAKSQHTAGINIGMLSLRIAEGLIPMLIIAYTAMLPVIAGLLAIASAAIAATLGLGGLMAIGLYKWSKDFDGSNMGYAGARRPYSSSNKTKGFWSEVFEPFAQSLSDPAIRGKIDSAVSWTKKVFQEDLPNAFGIFVQTLAAGNFSAIRRIMDMFTDWLPGAAEGLAKWGQQFLNLIGPESLTRMNNFFKYLAGGLMNMAMYLKDTDWRDFDSFFSIAAKFLSKLMDLGKSVLPLIVHQLERIYPYPLAPMIDKLVEFFDAIKNNEDAMDAAGSLAQITLVALAISTAIKFIGAVTLGLKFLIYGVIIMGIYTISEALIGLVFRLNWFFASLVDIIYTGFYNAMISLLNRIPGMEYEKLDYVNPMDAFDISNNGLYNELNMPGPDWLADRLDKRSAIDDDIDRLKTGYEYGKAVHGITEVGVRVFFDDDMNLAAVVEKDADAVIGSNGTSKRTVHGSGVNWG